MRLIRPRYLVPKLRLGTPIRRELPLHEVAFDCLLNRLKSEALEKEHSQAELGNEVNEMEERTSGTPSPRSSKTIRHIRENRWPVRFFIKSAAASHSRSLASIRDYQT